ncbi:MAG: DUF6273 domain-containing protein [Synergistaceae bacterium]|nr:DUF6273 domain-containing protein [Synergistaceae bacterium]
MKKRVFFGKHCGKISVLVVILIIFAFVTDTQASPKIGDIIEFGEWNWRVLDMQGSRALIIMEDMIERRPYCVNVQSANLTWETSNLREYLNGEFLQRFTEEEQGRIAESIINTPDNLWYGTKGGNDTTDKVFLLSLEELDKYFDNSGDYENKMRKKWDGNQWVSADNGMTLSNINDSSRVAKLGDQTSWWWLRSPGFDFGAAVVLGTGTVYIYGISVILDGGVRPVLWINL